MRIHLWTWNYTCVISPWESTEIKTKTISRSVFSSQILQNAEMNIVVHWKFWRKYGSVSNLFSCTGQICSWLQKVLISADWRTKVRSCAKKKFSAKVIWSEGMNKHHLSFVRDIISHDLPSCYVYSKLFWVKEARNP